MLPNRENANFDPSGDHVGSVAPQVDRSVSAASTGPRRVVQSNTPHTATAESATTSRSRFCFVNGSLNLNASRVHRAHDRVNLGSLWSSGVTFGSGQSAVNSKPG